MVTDEAGSAGWDDRLSLGRADMKTRGTGGCPERRTRRSGVPAMGQ